MYEVYKLRILLPLRLMTEGTVTCANEDLSKGFISFSVCGKAFYEDHAKNDLEL